MVELYDHQRAAIEQLKTGSILYGGVGSGKSRAALAYYFLKVCDGEYTEPFYSLHKPKDLYIITTARKRDTLEWEKECSIFQLTSYSEYDRLGVTVVIESWNNIGKFCKISDAFFIFDEQRVVGSGAWVKAFYQITKKNDWILLSATPGDTWSDYIPVFVANGFYKNKTQFCQEHVVYKPYNRYPQISHYVGVRKLEKLRDQILVRVDYVKQTIMHTIDIPVEYDKTTYREIARIRWNPYLNEPLRDSSALCYCLRRLCNSDANRLDKVRTLIDETPRLIIFYNFDYELELLRELVKEMHVTLAEWNGHKHEPIPGTSEWVYLVQYSAGAEGWNCTMTNAILFYSPNYSYKTMVQAAGRIDRLDTLYSDLYVYRLRSDAPIEKAIYRCLNEKKNFNERKYANFGSK